MMRTRRFLALLLLLLSVFILGDRRRPTRSDPVCPPVSLSISASPRSVCSTGVVTLSWQASDPRAIVLLDEFPGPHPASGSVTVSTGPRSFTGHASLACGTGPAGSVSVTGGALPSGSLSGASSVAQNNSTLLRVTASDTAQWSLSSTLGNSLSPSAGTTSQDVVYTASRSGNDTVTLRLTSACGDLATRSIGMSITPVSPPPPPPSGTLRCCDNTFSPTCTSCAHKQGCCSSHGGVCGC